MEKNHLGRLIACGPGLDGAKVLLQGTCIIRMGLAIVGRWQDALVHRKLEPPDEPGGDYRPRHRQRRKRSVGNMPGYPARLGALRGGGFWLSVFAVRTHLVEFVLREDDYREEMMQSVPRDLWIGPALATSDDCHEPMQFGSIKALGIEKPWAPPRSYGLLVRIDEEGEAVESLHSRVGGRQSRHHRGTRDGTGPGDRLQGQRPGAAGHHEEQGMSEVTDRAPEPPSPARPRPSGRRASRCCASSTAARSTAACTPSKRSNFDLYPGEVHALVGENGAGKSTLCKAIAGAIKLTSGDYYVDGKPVDFERPRDALAAGICMVYQETSLVPTMTAAQNIELGNEKLITSFKKLNIQAQQLLQSLELPHRSGDAGGDARHRQAADGRDRARCLQRRPHHHLRRTDGKPDAGRDRPLLQPGTRPARARRRHHLHLPCARGSCCRSPTASRCCATASWWLPRQTAEMTREKLVRAMVGRDITQTHYAATRKAMPSAGKLRREKVLTVENVTMGTIVKNMSFSVYAGEVVGIAGLIGSGRTEIAKIIFGALKRNLINGGTIKLRGKPIRYRVPKEAINDGIAYITEDRKLNGFFETMVVDDNVYIGKLATKAGWRFLLSGFTRNKLAAYWVERLKISALAAQGQDRRALRRQSAEGGHRQIAGAGSEHHLLRRADPRRRCRHHPRNPCPDPGACRRR